MDTTHTTPIVNTETYKPEYLLAADAFVGGKRGEIFESKLKYLSSIAK